MLLMSLVLKGRSSWLAVRYLEALEEDEWM